MQPNHASLDTALRDMLVSGDEDMKARAENIFFEERVDPDRQGPYEASLAMADATYEDWLGAHRDYLEGAVTTVLPETFLTRNRAAALQPTVWSELGKEQFLVRVECLDYVLTHTKANSLDDLAYRLGVYKGEIKDDRFTQGDAKALLEEVCWSLNTNPYAVRPRFAAFAQELENDIEAPDWANRLRDRLGLAHYPPKNRSGPWPVVLMRYKVGEVEDRARRAGADLPLTVPTVLDDMPYEIFHPAPRQADYGRTLHLGDNSGCDRLASEVLHLRIDYAPTHIWKVGAITTRADIAPERLAQLRETHLFCLRYTSERDDFGKL